MSTYYDILGLPPSLHNDPHLPAQTLKSAYRRALLRNHPDKNTTSAPNTKPNEKSFSIDQITQAFTILSDSRSRARYNKELKLYKGKEAGTKGEEEDWKTGLETLDLDDLEFEEGSTGTVWCRGCRCGDDKGFLVREEDLEEAADEGELCVGCRGCSLWLRVLFSVLEDDEGQADGANGTKNGDYGG